MARRVKPNPRGARRSTMGGLRLPVMVGESSRQGDVSRELAVLDPPPGDCIGPSSANDMTSDRPDVADSFLVGRQCLDKLGESVVGGVVSDLWLRPEQASRIHSTIQYLS